MADLIKIKNRIVRKAFPELKNIDIPVKYVKLKEPLFEYGEIGQGYFVNVNTVMRKAPLSTIEGGLAHELVHITEELKLPSPLRKKYEQLYGSYKRYRIISERNADLEVILRGYGSQLLSCHKYRRKIGRPDYDDNGLSINELKTILSFRRN